MWAGRDIMSQLAHISMDSPRIHGGQVPRQLQAADDLPRERI